MDKFEQRQNCRTGQQGKAHKYVDAGDETTLSMDLSGSISAIERDTVLRQVLAGAIAEYFQMSASAGHVYLLKVVLTNPDGLRRRVTSDLTPVNFVKRSLKIKWQIRASDAEEAWNLKERIGRSVIVSDLKTRFQNALTSTTNKMILSQVQVSAVHDIDVQRNPVVVYDNSL